MGGHKVSDPLSKLHKQNPADKLEDRPGARLYLVRVSIPSIQKTLATVVEVMDAYVDSPRIRLRARLDRLTREEVFKAVAIDSVRIQFEKAGFTEEQLIPATIAECKQVTAKEATDLIVEYARKEGD